MKILTNIIDLKEAISKLKNLSFVPTMGGLHDGHLSLINASKKKYKNTLVSIYVNPKQFNNKKDFKSYPRNIKKDLNLLKKLNIKIVFIPSTKEIYKEKRINKITLPKNQKILCAKFRKGHFEGVLDIMERFINLINPKYIFLGEKDFQQLFLIKKYLNTKYRAKIIGCRTIRDKNYVALSTRNHLISKKNMLIAGYIAKGLKNIKKKINRNKNIIHEYKKHLIKKFNIKIEYLEARCKVDLKRFKKNRKFKIFIAYYLNGVRLIDNF